jgi:hypothetical protein
MLRIIFSSELAKVFNAEDNLSKLSAFFYFLSENLLAAASCAQTAKTFKLFSVIQLSNIEKRKGAATFKFLEKLVRYRSKNNFRVF